MKKNIMIISIALIGLTLVFNANSWAARNKGGPHQKWDRPSNNMDKRDRGRSLAPGIQQHRPQDRFIPRLHKPDYHPAPHRFAPKLRPWLHRPEHYRAPYRFAPKPRPWLHRPFYRPFHPKRHYWWHRHGAVTNNYYGKAERYYAPEDEFSASAVISNTGFSVSIGVRETN